MKHNFLKRTMSVLLILCMLIGMIPAIIPEAHAAATPASSANTTATKVYTLKNLPIGVAVQNYYIGEKYIYTTQRSTNSTYLSRLKIEGNTATYVDHMVLTNWGHGETLDFYRYNGKEYFLVGSKADAATTSYWSTQIARIQYVPGKTYSNYTGVTRFTMLDCANSTGANDGDLYRVAAAVCGNYTIFRVQLADKTVRYSIYDTNKLNAALDKTTTSVYLEMKSSAAIAALVKTFKQSGNTYVHPNGSFQGIELSSKDSIYLSGGGYGDTPQIAMMNNSGSYKKLISITNVGKFEIEGMQADRGRLYFLIMPDPNGDGTITGAEKKVSQVIYYIPESVFGISHTITNIAGTAPTCTKAGLSDGANCTKCGFPQDVQETLPALGHTVVTVPGQEPTNTSAGWTESSYCSVCNAVLVARQELSALSYGKGDSEPLRLVIDYGKSVEFSIEDIHKCLFYNTSDVSASFLGIVTNGTHGRVYSEAPSELSLTKTGDSLDWQNGIYERSGELIRFTPDDIMNDINRVYAIFRMTENYASPWNWYLTVGIEIVPAKVMYYEAEELTQSGDLIFEEKIDDAVSNEVTVLTDTEDRQIPVNTYIPAYDENVVFFSFDNNAEDVMRYEKNSIYGGVNHDLLSNWSVFGAVNQYAFQGEINNPEGALNLHLSNPTGTWIQLRTAYSLKYKPCQDAWIEVRMRLNDVKANNGSTISFCPEFFANENNTALRTRPSTSITLSEKGQDWFILTFPLVTSNAWPGDYNYLDAALIRSISMTFEGLLPNYGQSISFDYFYVGPKETCPSNLNSDRLYFGFDSTPADQYRYYNPIYGKRNDFDKTPTYGDDWYFNESGTPSITMANGEMNIVAGAKGRTNTDSPYVQTLQELDYSVDRAEIAQVKLKLSGMTTDVVGGMFTDVPSVRLGFVLDDDVAYETSACWHDWPVTEEQLNGCDYMTLTADITELLAEHDAKKIRAVRLTIANASGISVDTGTVTVDYIYVGPKETQETDLYISEPSAAPEQDPPKHTYTPLYDDRVIFFGFENDIYDAGYYQNNKNYGGKNFNDKANWWAPSYGSITGISNGALVFYTKNTKDTWGYAGTGGGNTTNANAAEYPLNYTPSADDWCEIRMKIDGAVANSNSRLSFTLELFPTAGDSNARVRSGDYIAASKIGAGYFVMQFPMKGSTLSSSLNTTYTYATLPIIRRINFLISNAKANTAFTTSIDYFYVGPQELMPSKMDKSYLYFGFENDEAAQYKYTSEVYGANYDNGSHWMYNTTRSSAPTVANGMMTATVTSTGEPWFETRRNGNSGIFVMNYCPNAAPNNPEEVQVRVRFNNLQTGNNTSATLRAIFFDASDHRDATIREAKITIPASDVSTSGKWFTYRFKVGTALNGLEKSDSFRIAFANVISSSGTGTVDIDYIYIGPSLYIEPKELADSRSTYDRVYGYDPLYTEDTKYSDHKTIFTEGKGVPLLSYLTGDNGEYLLDDDNNKILAIDYASATQYTEAYFTFTGTGFDIISRTGVDQGALRVVVCDTEGHVKKNVSVLNKGNSELYQIPVVSVEMRDEDTKELIHGTYTVHIFVNAAYDYGNNGNADDFGGALDRGGEFYLDAIRIYNPINTAASTVDAKTAYETYQKHGEADPKFTEVRQKLIDASKETSSETMEGVVYLDTKDGSTTQIAKYAEVGPNNEVYLAPGKAIAFKIEATGTIPASIDIGAKSADGTPVTMSVSLAGVQTDTGIASSTAQYYPLRIAPGQWQSVGGKNYVTVSITNSGESGILSITDVKYAYDVPAVATTGGTYSLRFIVDRDVLPPVEETPTEDESLTFGEQLALENDLTMTFRLNPERIAAYDISTLYLEVERDVYGSDGSVAVKREILDEYVDDGRRLVFRLTGISAAQMNDAIRVTLHIKDAEGKEYVSPTLYTSITVYLRDTLTNMPTGYDKLYTLIMDMLNYGTAAQYYFNRHTDAPANEAFEIFKDYENYASADLSAPLEDMYGSTPNEGATGKLGQTLDLGTRIGITYKVTLPEGIATEDAVLVVKDAAGNELEKLQVAGNPTDDRGRYVVNFYGSTSRDMRRVVYATAYANGKAITGTYAYSISTYAWGIQENTSLYPANLVNVTRMMMLYGDSAANYFS